jgi:myosin heavy subunit
LINLLEEYPTGIFQLIDESSGLHCNDQVLLQVMNKQILEKKLKNEKSCSRASLKLKKPPQNNTLFKLMKKANDCFVIVHSIGEVVYNIIGFS